MDAEAFNRILIKTLQQVDDVLGQKANEYATADRLHNFKQAAALKKTTPIEALGGMMVKHTVSVYDLIGRDEFASPAMWDEKIIDHINYLILLRALVVEEYQSRTDREN